MKRTIIGAIAGSIVGGMTFFPPSIPIIFTLVLGLDADSIRKYSQTIDFLYMLFPAIGLVTGAIVGGLIGKKRVSLAPFRRKSCSIFFWCILLFSLLGIELGFIFSPVSQIGLGNTSTAIDLWIFSIIFGIVGTILGALVGLLVLVIYLCLSSQLTKRPPFSAG